MNNLKILFSLSLFILLSSCSNTDDAKVESQKEVEENQVVQVEEVEVVEEVEEVTPIKPVEPAEEVKEEVNLIDTSVFENVKNVEVIDAREITKHITLKIDLKDVTDPGMGTLSVLTEAFDFLEQDDIVGAETITLLVRVNEIKVSQFKIHVNNFKPDETTPMANLVVAASDIEFLTPEVEEFGKTMELW